MNDPIVPTQMTSLDNSPKKYKLTARHMESDKSDERVFRNRFGNFE